MKKALVCLVLVSILISSFAMSEGKIKVQQKALSVLAGDDSGYFFAKVENVGDAPIGVGSGSLVAFTEDDDILFVQDYISALPNNVLLQPGEYVYMRDFIWETVLAEATVGDFKFSVEENKYPREIKKIPCESSFVLEGADGRENSLYVTFTNTENEEKYNFYISAALLDAEGNIVYAESSSLGNFAIHAGSAITVKMNIDSDMVKYFAANNIVPESVDAMVCFFP